jgi:hypothetical protein
VTQLVSKVGDVIGDWLLGSRKELHENIKQKISESRKERAETIKSTGKIIGIEEESKTSKVRVSSNSDSGRKSVKKDIKVRASASTRMVAETAEKEKTELRQKKNRKEKKKEGYFGRNDSKKGKGKDEGKENEDIDKNKKKRKDRKMKSKEWGTGSKEQSRKENRDGSPRVIFVCSGE